ncbi:D-sedoheptulose-7-phosphate isomerase [Geopsychrobacter electrodiphilus]|uniref:D-sedoheptulose-7-phosphate isomerase n=1 Tax=Geopsychrobacter electrodiphilus TaxID=225196 RepID=UPI0003795F84|nr:D-sedoheptulose 7-phosphate isomerase [Geopsychrobacter electrodiphilus]
MKQQILNHLAEHQKAFDHLRSHMVGQIEAVADLMVGQLSKGHKILVMGNGGSAADAQHFAAELIGRFLAERRALPAIALTTDSSILTAVGNDYGFDQIFSRQVAALANPGDLVVGISTSGNSPNVLEALKIAAAGGVTTLGLVGRDGGKIAAVCDHVLCIPALYTPAIQEAHIAIIHILCDLIEKKMFGTGA